MVILFLFGIVLGIFVFVLIGVFVVVNGYFFVFNYGLIIVLIDFDIIGIIKIGKYIFNYSFMFLGLLSMVFCLVFGLVLFNVLF